MAGTFDTVTLFCLGTVPGPKFLRGLTQNDHSVVLTEFQDIPIGTTAWRRGQSASGHTWTLRCVGLPPPGIDPGQLFLFGSSSGAVIITPESPGEKPQTWHARQVGEGFTLENIALRDAGIKARFLDGRTGTGDVGLAPNTDPPFTGTHWLVRPLTGSGPFLE